MPNKFKHRSLQKEMLDEPNIDANLLRKNLKELDFLNKFTGGYRISMKGIKQLVYIHNKTYHIVDLGCGSGDFLVNIANWARKNNLKVQLTGVDFNPDAIAYLNSHCSGYPEINGVCSNYSDFLSENKNIDIVHCSLFCHHLSHEELVRLFVYFKQNLQCGFVINDLKRNWLAYGAAWLFPRLLNGTEMAKSDGPISVLRGFKYYEIRQLMATATIKNYSIHRARPFRFLVVGNI